MENGQIIDIKVRFIKTDHEHGCDLCCFWSEAFCTNPPQCTCEDDGYFEYVTQNKEIKNETPEKNK